jgi:hypothetical protein
MATTPNYGWVMPDPTDFVTDLPADFEIFGDAVDATVDGIETIANAALPETIIDAAGDLIYGSAADTAARLAIGTAGQLLAVNSGATAPEWVTPAASGGMTLLSTTAISGSSTTVSSISQDYTDLVIVVSGYVYGTGASSIQMGLDGAGDSLNYQVNIYGTTSFAGAVSGFPNGFIRPTYNASHTNGEPFDCTLTISRYASADGVKNWIYRSVFHNNAESAFRANLGGGGFKSTSGIDSFTLTNNQSRTATAGNIYIYGVS